MSTADGPSGEALMHAYGELIRIVTQREREGLERMVNHCVAMGHGTVAGALDVLPTLPYVVERLTLLAGRYSVPIPQYSEAERLDARQQILDAAEERRNGQD